MSPTPKKVNKDTIYIDVEDEITAIIDKLHKAEAKVVALVLPKRAVTLQSVVNLKLLKRAAETAKKNIVLITSDSGVMSLAGLAGLHVAKTLQSKPTVPAVTTHADVPITVDSDAEPATTAEPEPVLNPKASIGSLAGEEEPIEVGDTAAVAAAAAVKPKKSKDRKFSIPNFDAFRTKLLLGGAALLLLIVGWVFAAIILPKALITIATDTSQVNTSISLEAKVDQKTAELDKSILPITKKELKKSSVEKVPTTGKRDDGSKATGTLTLTNCIKDNDGFSLPAGTIFSSAGLNFTTNEAVTLPGAVYQGSNCKSATFGQSKTVAVTAEAGGSKYNLSSRSYSVPGQYTSTSGSLIATGTDMTGGTTQLVSVVSQADIDAAKQQALDKLSQAAASELKKQFSSDQGVGLEGSIENQTPTTTSDPEVGKEATDVSVTVNVTFAMYGLKRDDAVRLIEKEASKKIDTAKQTIQNTGLDQADVHVTDKPAAGVFRVSIQTTAVAGPKLDTDGIKREIAGKRSGQAHDIITERPGVTDVKIKYSPFWVTSTPKKTSHITIIFNEADAKNQ